MKEVFNKKELFDLVAKNKLEKVCGKLRDITQNQNHLVEEHDSAVLHNRELVAISNKFEKTVNDEERLRKIGSNILKIISLIEQKMRLAEFERVKNQNNLNSFLHFLKSYKFEQPISTTINSIEESISELKVSLEKEKKQFIQEIKKLKSTASRYKKSLESERNKVNHLQTEFNAYQTQKAADEEQLSKRGNEIKKLEQEINKHKNESDAKNHLQKELERLKTEKISYEEQIKERDNKINQLREEIKNHNLTIDKYNENLKEADESIKDLLEKNEALQKLNSQEDFTQELESIENKIASKNSYLEKKKKEISILEKEIKIKDAEIAKLHSEERQLDKEKTQKRRVIMILLLFLLPTLFALNFASKHSKTQLENRNLIAQLDSLEEIILLPNDSLKNSKTMDSLRLIIASYKEDTTSTDPPNLALTQILLDCKNNVANLERIINRNNSNCTQTKKKLKEQIASTENTVGRLQRIIDLHHKPSSTAKTSSSTDEISIAILSCNEKIPTNLLNKLNNSTPISLVSKVSVLDALESIGSSQDGYCGSSNKEAMNQDLKRILKVDFIFSI